MHRTCPGVPIDCCPMEWHQKELASRLDEKENVICRHKKTPGPAASNIPFKATETGAWSPNQLFIISTAQGAAVDVPY